jgi:hypothetical protein
MVAQVRALLAPGLVAGDAVDLLTEYVCVAVVARVLLDHVNLDQRRSMLPGAGARMCHLTAFPRQPRGQGALGRKRREVCLGAAGLSEVDVPVGRLLAPDR